MRLNTNNLLSYNQDRAAPHYSLVDEGPKRSKTRLLTKKKKKESNIEDEPDLVPYKERPGNRIGDPCPL